MTFYFGFYYFLSVIVLNRKSHLYYLIFTIKIGCIAGEKGPNEKGPDEKRTGNKDPSKKDLTNKDHFF